MFKRLRGLRDAYTHDINLFRVGKALMVPWFRGSLGRDLTSDEMTSISQGAQALEDEIKCHLYFGCPRCKHFYGDIFSEVL